ncbi:MAG: hypothetical protein FWB71_07340 [Defluviitaleaceae bacterium]|nr:hypothetical protein [Defluviitaleaceae bacterium]
MERQFDFREARKNPYAEIISEKGYSITEHYTAEDVANGDFDDTKDIIAALVELMSAEETARLLRHIRDNFDLSISPSVWHVFDAK